MKIIGIGVDLVENKRIKSSIKNINFINRVFGKKEIIMSKKISNRINFFSKRFAAKEAFVKALGTGFRKGIFWKDISVLNNLNGKPELVIRGQAKVCLNSILPADTRPIIHISISDEKEIVNAIVIIEARDLNHLN